MCPAAVRSRVLLSLPIQLTNYLQMPPHSEEATQAIRARQELQSCLGVHSTALFCTPACSGVGNPHTRPLNLIGPQQHAQHCHSQSKPPPRTPHPGPTRTPSTAPKLANGSPAAAAARLGVVEVGALESGLRVDLHPSVVGDACRVCACRGLDRWGACEGEARLQER